ncbi:MAG: REP-associated tyrosine transposase [Gammaproteobacteria bacterium]
MLTVTLIASITLDSMSNGRCAYIDGDAWFFTVNLLQRHRNDSLVRKIGPLRQTVNKVRPNSPFHIDARVVLSDHFHCVWTLPPDDADFSNRWRLIKNGLKRGGRQFVSIAAHSLSNI